MMLSAVWSIGAYRTARESLGLFLSASAAVKDQGDPPAAGVVEVGQLPDQLSAGGAGLAEVEGTKFRPGVDDAVAVHQKITGRGIRYGPRGGAHPADLGAAPVFLVSFFLFQ